MMLRSKKNPAEGTRCKGSIEGGKLTVILLDWPGYRVCYLAVVMMTESGAKALGLEGFEGLLLVHLNILPCYCYEKQMGSAVVVICPKGLQGILSLEMCANIPQVLSFADIYTDELMES
jgi:hypothetical protein